MFFNLFFNGLRGADTVGANSERLVNFALLLVIFAAICISIVGQYNGLASFMGSTGTTVEGTESGHITDIGAYRNEWLVDSGNGAPVTGKNAGFDTVCQVFPTLGICQ